MKIILGQGNPEKQYDGTRHNVGFLSLDFFAAKHDISFQSKEKFHADIAEATVGDEKVLLVKPTTFYNETGKSARALADFYKIDPTDILVIHDDLALPFGTLRTREKGSDAGNNGIKSLNAHLGENYGRIRVGIWNDFADRVPATHFVLTKFSAEESEKLTTDILSKINELIDNFITGTHSATSYKL
jgi:PTH1 family peptidyl-tRNA hydrolase